MTDKQRKQLLDYAMKFNSSLKFLARVYALKKKGTFEEEKALRVCKRLDIIASEETMWMIQNTGPYILRYGDMISKREWKKFIDMDFREEKDRYKVSKDGMNPTHTDRTMDEKIGFIKRIVTDTSDEERELLLDNIVNMLSVYCQYALYVKKYGIPDGTTVS